MLNLARIEIKCPCGAEYNVATINNDFRFEIGCQCKRDLLIEVYKEGYTMMRAELSVTKIPAIITDKSRYKAIKAKYAVIEYINGDMAKFAHFKYGRYKYADFQAECGDNESILCRMDTNKIETEPEWNKVKANTKTTLNFFLFSNDLKPFENKNIIKFPKKS